MEAFQPDRHVISIGPDRCVDPYVANLYRPAPAHEILARRERINAIYRQLSGSQVVVLTLGLVEAWFDRRAGGYINQAPYKSAVAAEPDRFELHVLDYNDVLAMLRELLALLEQVCPAEHRIILTVSPVPLEATFTEADVAVANSYSKSVLRAAAEAIVGEAGRVEYFPSYESVTLTSRERAFREDQIHVTPELVRFNVDRLIGRYVGSPDEETPRVAIDRAAASRRDGGAGSALKILQEAWAAHPKDAPLTLVLAQEHFRRGTPAAGEKLLAGFLAETDDASVRLALAQHCCDAGRWEDALLHGERAAMANPRSLSFQLPRIMASYHLGRRHEGLALLDSVRFVAARRPLVLFWRARFHEKLGSSDQAEALYRECAETTEDLAHIAAFLEFLAARAQRDELLIWTGRLLELDPSNAIALRLRQEAAALIAP